MSNDESSKPSLLQVLRSVMSASFGVQKRENLERDFQHGNAGQYIVIGLVFTLFFILGIWGLVQLAFWAFGV